MTLPPKLLGQSVHPILIGEKRVIYSEIMQTHKSYWVHLPSDYEKNTRSYPVLFITDGGEHFNLATGVCEFMSSQYLIPEMIVVALLHDDRNHDLTPTFSRTNLNGFESDGAKVSGGGVSFIQFLEKELIPQVEQDFKTCSYRILAGHSLGGLLTVYAYLKHNTLFNAYIAMDPALNWDNHYCQRVIEDSTFDRDEFQHPLYLSSAHNAPKDRPDESPMRLSQIAFGKALIDHQINQFQHDFFENENHLTVPHRSLFEGLKYTFNGYYILEDPQFELEVVFIDRFYKEQSEIYQYEINAPERLTEMFGKYFLFDLNEYEKAEEFFEYNVSLYPNSARVYKYLAKTNEAKGNHDKALAYLKKALELNPQDQNLKEELQALDKH